MAKLVDPEGDRTIGVITKLDLMDQGTDASDILNGKVIPLKRGFIGVVNRSQLNINQRLPIQQSLQNELNFFKSHPVYAQMLNKLGTSTLATTLNKMLIEHIKHTLPEIRRTIEQKLEQLTKELDELGGPLLALQDKRARLVTILNIYSKDFRAALEGRSPDVLTATELFGGARIAYIFKEIFTKTLDAIDPLAGLRDEEIRNAIRNSTGVTATLFLPRVVQSLIQRQLARTKDPSLQCAKLCRDELVKISTSVAKKQLQLYEELRQVLYNQVSSFLDTLFETCSTKITNFLEMQLSYINTDKPECQAVLNTLPESQEQTRFQKLQAAVKQETKQVAAAATVGSVQSQLKSGYLWKQGQKLKGWKRRYFNYDGVYLLYFESNQKGERAHGSVHMRQANVSYADPREAEGFGFKIRTPDRDILLKADTKEEMDSWVNALRSTKIDAADKKEEEAADGQANGQQGAAKPSGQGQQGQNQGQNGLPPAGPTAPAQKPKAAPSRPTQSKKRKQRRGGSGLLARYRVPDENAVHLPAVPYSIRPPVNPEERMKTELCKRLLVAYFVVARKYIRDAVPKAVMTFLVCKAKDDLQFMLGQFQASEGMDELMKESGAAAQQRQLIQQQLESLRKAMKAIRDVGELPAESVETEAAGLRNLNAAAAAAAPGPAPAAAPVPQWSMPAPAAAPPPQMPWQTQPAPAAAAPPPWMSQPQGPPAPTPLPVAAPLSSRASFPGPAPSFPGAPPPSLPMSFPSTAPSAAPLPFPARPPAAAPAPSFASSLPRQSSPVPSFPSPAPVSPNPASSVGPPAPAGPPGVAPSSGAPAPVDWMSMFKSGAPAASAAKK